MNLDDKRDLVFTRDNYICQVCGTHLSNGRAQMGHIIGNTKVNRVLYGKAIIDSPHNVLSTCSLECNKKCDIGQREDIAEKLIEIYSDPFFYAGSEKYFIKDLLKNEGYL